MAYAHATLGERFSEPWLHHAGNKAPRWEVYDRLLGKTVEEHKALYENAHGPIPDGAVVHHVDFDPTNNDISNLAAVDKRTHMRLHAGWKQVDGAWRKTCAKCLRTLPEEMFSFLSLSHRSRRSRCNQCRYADNVRYRTREG